MKFISYFISLAVIVACLACSNLIKNDDRTLASVDIPTMSIPSLQEQLRRVDPNKPTVCSITLNSVDERDIFNYYLKQDFNFVELVTNKHVAGHQWLYNACDSGLTCDVLLVSGHYAHTFYSKESAATLSSKVLEQNSCAGSNQQFRCGGILQNPKEVYLFGCNTTAGKEPDSRSLEEYIKVLIKEGISPDRAATIAAFRYSLFGRNAYEIMQSIFHSAKVYGFTSKAPLGRQIKPALLKYMDSFPNGYLTDHYNKIDKSSPNKTWDDLMKRNTWGARTVPGDSGIESPQCELYGDKNLIDKMLWVERSLNDTEKALFVIPEVSEFYRNTLQKQYGRNLENLPQPAKVINNRIKNNQVLRNKLLANIGDKPKKNFMYYQGQAFIYLDSLGLMSTPVLVKSFEKFAKPLLTKDDAVFKEEYKLLCSFFESVDGAGDYFDLKITDLTTKLDKESVWNANLVRTLGCMKTKDKDLLFELRQIASGKAGRTPNMVKMAQEALVKINKR